MKRGVNDFPFFVSVAVRPPGRAGMSAPGAGFVPGIEWAREMGRGVTDKMAGTKGAPIRVRGRGIPYNNA